MLLNERRTDSESNNILIIRDLYDPLTVMPEPRGPEGPLAPPIFGRSVNPSPTRGGRFCTPFTTSTTKRLPQHESPYQTSFIHTVVVFGLSEDFKPVLGLCNWL